MERAAWTDERLDELSESMRSGFGRVDDEFRAVRAEMHGGFTALRSDMHGGFAELRGEINELRRIMLGAGGGIILALIGVIAAILARGA